MDPAEENNLGAVGVVDGEKADPIIVRKALVKELEDIQHRMAGLIQLKDRVSRQARLEALQKESGELRADIEQIDQIIRLTPPSPPSIKSTSETGSR